MSRRQAREDALRILYLYDICASDLEEAQAIIWHEKKPPEKDESFARELFTGTVKNLTVIDGHIARYSKNWSIERISAVDKNILRLAIYEILYTPRTPVKVIINEAIEISKIFSTEKSKIFINGILDKIKDLRNQPERIIESD